MCERLGESAKECVSLKEVGLVCERFGQDGLGKFGLGCFRFG